jgi:TatD DNase family protein
VFDPVENLNSSYLEAKYLLHKVEEYFAHIFMLIDTHAHVNFSAFKDDADATIHRALDAGMCVVNVGTQTDTSRSAVDMANTYERVYAVIGIHPVHTYQQMLDEEESRFKTRAEEFDRDIYYQLGQNEKVVGIGECGLDYYRLPENTNHEAIKALQKETFVGQIRLAKELDKALVIHCRPSAGTQDAYEDILEILDAEIIQGHRFEIHSFTGSPEIALKFLDRGAYVGLNGIITFDKSGNMQKVAETVPLDRIVLETDSPYLTPLPHRGKRNEPSYVKFVAEKVAQIKNALLDEVEEETTNNAKQLFNL